MPPGCLRGYARVSTGEQTLDGQRDALCALGCAEIVEERASGAERRRPELLRLLDRMQGGDTLVVTRLDRLARSLAHLHEIIAVLRERGAFLRVLASPIDTAAPHGMLMFSLLGAFAEFERDLIRERTRAGLTAARQRGRIGGNPGLRARDPEALRALKETRDRHYLGGLIAGAEDWLPTVRRLHRDGKSRTVMVAELNKALHQDGAGGRAWTESRLGRALHRLVREHLAEPELLERAPPDRRTPHVMEMAVAIARANPDLTLAEIGRQLETAGQRTPRGRANWLPGSVKNLLDRARKKGLF